MIGKNLFLAERHPFLSKVVLQGRIAWSINLRWIAVLTFLITLIVVKYAFELNLPYHNILTVLIVLVLFNLICFIFFRWFKKFSLKSEFIFLTIQILVDLLILTALLNLTGGIRNPLYLFYLFHTIPAVFVELQCGLVTGFRPDPLLCLVL